MPFTFQENLQQRYYKALCDAIKLEFNFTKQVATGQVEGRQDVMDKFLKSLNTGLGLLKGVPIAGEFIKIGVDIVGAISTCVQMYRSNEKKNKLRGFAESLTRCDSHKQYEMYINNIAREITYRYGVNLVFLIRLHQEESNALKIIDTIAHVAALRIMFYALTEGVSIENCEALVNGLVDGYEGLSGTQLTHVLNKITMFERMLGGTTFSAEGFYARCGYYVPSGQEYQYYIDRNSNGPKKQQFVSYHDYPKPDPNALPGEPNQSKYKSKKSKNGKESRDELTPKYGYAMSAMLPKSANFPDGLGRHFPQNNMENPFLRILAMNQCQFVSSDHLEKYLASAGGKVHTIDFTTWLRKTYPTIFRGESLYPIFRGSIQDDLLKHKGLSFEHGLFNQCDFSFCYFYRVNISRLTNCMVVGSDIRQCSATAGSLNGSDFTLAKITDCNFKKLSGIFIANFATITSSYFNGSSFLFQYEGAIIDPITTDSFVECITEVHGSKENLGILIKESMLIYERKIAAQQQASERVKDERDAHQREFNINIEEQLAAIRKIALENQEKMAEMGNKSQTDSSEEGKSVSMYEFTEEERQRILAFHKTTIEESIQTLTTVVTEDNILAKLFDSLFFSKPAMLLRELASVPANMTWASVPRLMKYDVQGLPGPHGKFGEDGESGGYGGGAGTDGTDGLDGQAGTSAGSMAVSVISVPNQNVFLVTPKAANPVMLPLFDSSVSVQLSAKGGKGGDGGAGGKGGDGAAGIDGTDATPDQMGTSGTNGGNGGRGGNGGHGANAGLSGNIDVYVKEADIDLLVCLDQADVSQAEGGRGGAFGVGGVGGQGGKGGKPAVKTISARNSDGSYTYSYINIPGGSPGINGRPGNDGKSGQDGSPGRAGKLSFFVIPSSGGDINEYGRIFELRLFGFKDFTSNTGIIEPGQRLKVENIMIQNIGGMKSPKNRIEIHLLGNDMVVIDNNQWSILPEEIAQNKTFSYPQDLKFSFQVARVIMTQPREVYQTVVKVPLAAVVTRLKRRIKDFNAIPKSITVRYPLELSTCCGALTLAVDNRVPFTVKLRNVSRVALGSFSSFPRRVRVEICIPYGDFSALYPNYRIEQDSKSSDTFSLTDSVICDVQYIEGQQELLFSGSLSIDQLPKERAYERLPLQVSLHLGDIDDPMSMSSMNRIQQETFDIQITESVRLPLLASDMLLVINHLTTKAEVAHWTEIASQLHMQVNVWNVSLYCGFSYFYPLVSAVEHMKNGLVVFLNTLCHRDDRSAFLKDKKYFPLEDLAVSEIFEAARRHGIRTYVVNEQQNGVNAGQCLFPQLNTPLAGLARKEGMQRILENPDITIPVLEEDETKKSSSPVKHRIVSFMNRNQLQARRDEKAIKAKKAKQAKRKVETYDRCDSVPNFEAVADELSGLIDPAAEDAANTKSPEYLQNLMNESSTNDATPTKEKDEMNEDGMIDVAMDQPTDGEGDVDFGDDAEQVGDELEIEEPDDSRATVVGLSIVDIESLDELQFISRTAFYDYLSWLNTGGRDEHLSPHYQYVSIRQTRWFTRPDSIALMKRLDTLIQKNDFHCPGRQYFYYPKFNSSRIENSNTFFPRYIVGEIEIRRGLDTSYAMIAVRNVIPSPPIVPPSSQAPTAPIAVGKVVEVIGNSNVPATTAPVSSIAPSSPFTCGSDLAIIIKLLPFKQKLHLFSEVISPIDNPTLHNMLSDMIVSDLVDEQFVLTNHYERYVLVMSDKKLNVWSVALRMFVGHDFHGLCRNALESQPVQVTEEPSIAMDAVPVIEPAPDTVAPSAPPESPTNDPATSEVGHDHVPTDPSAPPLPPSEATPPPAPTPPPKPVRKPPTPGQQALLHILYKLRALYSRYFRKLVVVPSKLETFISQLCDTMRVTYFPYLTTDDIAKGANEWYASVGRPTMRLLMSLLRDPYKLSLQGVYLNHWSIPKDIILQDNALQLFSPRYEELKPDRYRKQVIDGNEGEYVVANRDGFFSNHCQYRTPLPTLYERETVDTPIRSTTTHAHMNTVVYYGSHYVANVDVADDDENDVGVIAEDDEN